MITWRRDYNNVDSLKHHHSLCFRWDVWINGDHCRFHRLYRDSESFILGSMPQWITTSNLLKCSTQGRTLCCKLPHATMDYNQKFTKKYHSGALAVPQIACFRGPNLRRMFDGKNPDGSESRSITFWLPLTVLCVLTQLNQLWVCINNTRLTLIEVNRSWRAHLRLALKKACPSTTTFWLSKNKLVSDSHCLAVHFLALSSLVSEISSFSNRHEAQEGSELDPSRFLHQHG